MAASVLAALVALGSAAPGFAAGWTVIPAPAPDAAPTAASPAGPTAVPRPAAPADAPAVEAEPPIAPLSPARQLLNAADAAIGARNLGRAQGLFARIVWEHPGSPEAAEARRALSVIELRDRGAGARPAGTKPASSEEPADGDSVVVRHEPYSLRTAERLRLTTWEKLDFGVTAFLYGMSLGLTFSLGLDNPDSGEVTTPLVLGAAFYTLGAVAYLKVANPDRGDLPLMMAITSYVPTATLLISNAAFDNPSEKKVAYATAAAGLASIPLAIAITQKLDLDPGDTQLVRDAGFWGLLTCTTATLGFGRRNDFGFSQQPSGQKVAGMGLLGLGGGLGLGLLAAKTSEVSLERVRVATWGGYGGAILGALIGISADSGNGDGTASVYKGITVGALTGLVITFIASSSLDGIPTSDDDPPKTSLRWVPGLTPLVGADGRQIPGLGFAGRL